MDHDQRYPWTMIHIPWIIPGFGPSDNHCTVKSGVYPQRSYPAALLSLAAIALCSDDGGSFEKNLAVTFLRLAIS